MMMSAASLQDHETELAEACRHDLGKSTFEAYSAEIDWCLNDIAFVCKNLARWAKDEKAVDIPITLAPLNPKIRKDPLGCVLVIG
jgi:beta-apo-4'-carotenal oxygenase